MSELIIKMPMRHNSRTGNVSLSKDQWNAIMCGEYDRLKIILKRDSTIVVNTEIHNWMIEHVRHYEDYVVMPYSKGSPLVRYSR